MDTSVIRVGDLVKVDDGLVWFGMCRQKIPGGLMVSFLTGDKSPRHVKPSQVIGHWRKTKATVRREEVRASE